jgi:hypothetical protein
MNIFLTRNKVPNQLAAKYFTWITHELGRIKLTFYRILFIFSLYSANNA